MKIVIGLGVQKSGTTALYSSFVGLENLFHKPVQKECHFMENPNANISNYVETCFNNKSSSKYNFEITPLYLNSIHAVYNIMKLSIAIPSMFVILRNPVYRSISSAGEKGYTSNRYKNHINTFEPIIKKCYSEMFTDLSEFYKCSKININQNIFYRGIYAPMLEHWGRNIQSNKIYVYSSDELFKDYKSVSSRIVKDMTGIVTQPKFIKTNSKSYKIQLNKSFINHGYKLYNPYNLELKCRFPHILSNVDWVQKSGNCTVNHTVSINSYKFIYNKQ